MAKPITQVGPRLGIINTAVVYPVLNTEQVAVWDANAGASDSNGWSSLLIARTGVALQTVTTFGSVRPLVSATPSTLMTLYESPDNATFGGVLNVSMAVTTGSRIPPSVTHDSVMTGVLYADGVLALSNSTAVTPPAGCALLRSSGGTLQYQNVGGSWLPIGAAAAGSAGQIQFANSSGALAASAYLTWDNAGYVLAVNGTVNVVGSIQISESTVITNAGVFVGSGVQCPEFGVQAAGFNPYVGGVAYSGSSEDLDFTSSGGFKVGGGSYNRISVRGGAIIGLS